MVKGTKVTKKRSYYYWRRKRFKQIASNYAMAKLDIMRHVIISSTGAKFDAPNASTMQLRYILNNSSDYQKYRQLYQSLKVCGLAMYIVYGGGTLNWGDDPGSTCISLLSDADGTSFDDIAEADGALILATATQNSKKYWSFKGASTGWIAIEQIDLLPGKIGVACSRNPIGGTAFFTIKFTVYCTFKIKN